MTECMTLDDLLPQLAHSYSRGLLVPFLGAGMSAGACPLWKEFVFHLENRAEIDSSDQQDEISSAELIQRAARAVRRLKNRAPGEFANGIGEILQLPNARKPEASDELARIWWPLVITTNYDDWFLTLWNQHHSEGRPLPALLELKLCGRNRPDCERILNSLRAPDNPLLWALQGFVGGQVAAVLGKQRRFGPDNSAELSAELVVGHEEYRHEAHGAPGFRRAFAEVFRSRSFLFLGTSLSDPYFLNLFDEVLELQGSIPHPHYAFVKRRTVNCGFLRDRLQILAVEYGDHKDLPSMISSMARELYAQQPRQTDWSYSLRSFAHPVQSEGEDLKILRKGLSHPLPGGCLSISVGIRNDDQLRIGKGHEILAEIFGPEAADLLSTQRISPHVWKIEDLPAYLVAARDLEFTDYRDARVIRTATTELLTCAEAAGFTIVQSMLLAAGQHRKFLPYISLVQMIKAFAAYRSEHEQSRLKLFIYVVDPGVLSLLGSGRVDVSELLYMERTRFWIEIWRSRREVLRFLEFARGTTPLREILEPYDVDRGWEFHVIPSPIEHPKVLTTGQIFDPESRWTVASAGLLPGSTLRLVPSTPFRDPLPHWA